MVRVSDPKIQKHPPVSYVLLRKLFSWSSYFSPGEIILEKIFGLLILFVFRVWFVYRSKIWRPWGPKRKIWRPLYEGLQPCFSLIACMFVMSLKTLKTFINCIILWYRNKKIHFCPSGSSVDIRRYTKTNQMHDWRSFAWSSEVFRSCFRE